MDKPTKKKKETYIESIIIELMNKHGVTKSTVQKAIRGERKSLMSMQIQKEYRAAEFVSQKAITKKLQKD